MELWQPLTVCGIEDPRQHRICVGITKQGKPCRLRVSQSTRENAWHRLESLSLFPVNLDHAKAILESIAGMLLCKRLHQGQSCQVSKKWLEGIKNGRQSSRSLTSASRVSSFVPWSPLGRDAGVISLTHSEESSAQQQTNSTPRGDEAREVTIEALKQNEVPFKVSSSRLAVVHVRTTDSRTESIILRSFRSRRISGVYCSICHSDEPAGNISLSCEECSCDFHWGCLERWFSVRSSSAQHTCPHW